MQTCFPPRNNRLEEDMNILFIKSNRNAKYVSHALHGKKMNFQDLKARVCQLTGRKWEHYKQSQREEGLGKEATWGRWAVLPHAEKVLLKTGMEVMMSKHHKPEVKTQLFGGSCLNEYNWLITSHTGI